MDYTHIGKVEWVLSNLIDNAVRHSNIGGKITIYVSEKENNKFNLAVINNGTGMNENELASIFDARYRASNAICDSKEYAALGLAITQKLLRLLPSKINT